MPEAQALNEEEQKLFDGMREEQKGEPPAKIEKEAAAPAPEAKTDKPSPEKEKPAEKKMVPVEAVAEARRENRDLKKELETLRAQVADGNTKLQRFMDGVQKRVEEETKPKFEDNPALALKAENEQLAKDLKEIRDRLAKQDAAAQQGNQLNQHAAFVQRKEAEFSKTQPKYFEAANYVAAMWSDEFKEAGYPEEQIPGLVFQKSIGVTNQAARSEKNPAEVIWNIAKRNGFKVDEPKVEEKKPAAGKSKLEQVAKGLEAAKTPGGGSGPDDLTLASIAQMDDDQIDKLVSDQDWWNKNVRRTPLH